MSENQIWRHLQINRRRTSVQDFYTKISLRQMRVSDLYANEALHVQNEKSKAAMLNRPDSYLNDAIDLRVILTETPVFSSAPWSSGTRLQHFMLIKQLSYPYIML